MACALNSAPEYQTESGPGDRYRQHDLIRAYANERAQDELAHAERSAAAHRIVTWFLWGADSANAAAERMRLRLDASERTGTALDFADATDAFEWLSAERLNLMAAVGMAADYEHNDVAWQLPWLLEEFFISRLHLADWTSSCTVGLSSARRAGDAGAEARMLGVLANSHYKMGDAAQSIDCRTQALEVYRRSGDRRAEANATASLGMTHLLAGDITGAITWGERAVPMVRAESTAYALSSALNSLGSAYHEAGRYDDAIRVFTGSLDAAREAGSRLAEAATLDELALTLHRCGKLTEAIGYMRQALDLSQQLADAQGEADILQHLAAVLDDAGEPAEAQTCRERSQAIHADLTHLAPAGGCSTVRTWPGPQG